MLTVAFTGAGTARHEWGPTALKSVAYGPHPRIHKRSSGQTGNRAKGPGPFQGSNPGNHATGEGREHQVDSGGTSSLHGGLARLLRLLRTSRGADLPHALGTAQASMRPLAAVEDHAPSPGGIVATRGTPATGNQHCWQWSWPLVPGLRQSPFCRAFQCILPSPRSSFAIRQLLA